MPRHPVVPCQRCCSALVACLKIPGGDSDTLPAAQRSIPHASEPHRTLKVLQDLRGHRAASALPLCSYTQESRPIQL